MGTEIIKADYSHLPIVDRRIFHAQASHGKKFRDMERGELVSCFLLRIEDNMESISRAINSSLQLSKRGGGVALLLSNLREAGAPIKKVEGQSSGVIPVMKLLEDSFSYANPPWYRDWGRLALKLSEG